jgi:hypothetical protein
MVDGMHPAIFDQGLFFKTDLVPSSAYYQSKICILRRINSQLSKEAGLDTLRSSTTET